MAQYKTGSVNVQNNSATVTGVNTGWLGEIDPGDLFSITGDTVIYTVASVASNTSLTLTAPYSGTTKTGSAYAITRDFTPNIGLPYLRAGDTEFSAVWRRAMDRLDVLVGNPTGTVYDLLNDTTPQLGGDLDVNGKLITSTANGNIRLVPNGTGKVYLGSCAFPSTVGTNNQVLYSDGTGTLWWGTPPSGSGTGEANTASNLGTGQGIYSQKVGIDLKFKSLVAGNNVTLTADANTITIAANAGTAVSSITAGTGLTGGTITTSGTIALATSGVTAGTYAACDVTVDTYGRITAAVANTTVAKKDVVSQWSKQQHYQPLVSNVTGTYPVDLDNYPFAVLTLTGNTTLNVTNLRAGGQYTFIIKQDATGGRTLTFGSTFKFPDSETPTMTTTASKADIYSFVSDGTYAYCVGVQNYL